jgi:hypothetical protein
MKSFSIAERSKKKMSRAASDTPRRVYEILYMVDIKTLLRRNLYIIVIQQLTAGDFWRFFIPLISCLQRDLYHENKACLGCQRTNTPEISIKMGYLK